MPGLLGRLKSFGKQVDDKTKNARVTGAVLFHTAAPVAGPVSQGYVAPPSTPTEYSQQIVREEQGQWAEVSKQHTERENAQLGTRATGTPQAPAAGRQQLPARGGNAGRAGTNAGKTGHDAGTAKTGTPARGQRPQPQTRSQPATGRGPAPTPGRSSSHGGSAGHSSGRPAGR